MPSGLTCNIYDGSDLTLRGFALRCVSQLGAGYEVTECGEKQMPLDKAPELKVSNRHQEALDRAVCVLNRWKEIEEDPELSKQVYNKERIRREAYVAQFKDNIDKIKGRYMKMIEKVESWELDNRYTSLKELMLNQLHESMEHDCGAILLDESPMLPIDEWIKKNIEAAEWSIEYHSKAIEKEKQRVTEVNSYLKGLYDAIDKEEPIIQVV